MSEQLHQIGLRIKELREIAGLPVENLADEFGIPPDTYQLYESGTEDIPVGILLEIARKFSVDLNEILTGESPRLHAYSLVRKGKGMSVERRRPYGYQSLAYNFLHKKAEPFLVTVNTESDEALVPTNTHPGQEFIYVIEGTVKVIVGKHELVLNEEDSLFFDSGLEHGMKALNGKPARFLAIIL
jgi:transcriptional regulator with XRE-family HTH domain